MDVLLVRDGRTRNLQASAVLWCYFPGLRDTTTGMKVFKVIK